MTSDEYETITQLEERCLKTLEDDVPVAVNLMHRLVRELLDRVAMDASNAAEQAQAEERAAVVTFLRGARMDELADAVLRGDHRTQEEP